MDRLSFKLSVRKMSVLLLHFHYYDMIHIILTNNHF